MRHDVILKYTLGVSAMFNLYWLFNLLVSKQLREKYQMGGDRMSILSLAVLYLPGLGLLYLFIRDLPVAPVGQVSFGAAEYLIVLMAQFFALVLMGVFSVIEMKLLGSDPKEMADKKDKQSLWHVVSLLLIIPLLEELITRKMLGDRMGEYDGMVFICLSALVFSLIHLQTGRIAVPVGMYYAGFLWAWVYVASGSLLVSTLYHILFNLALTIIPDHLKEKHSEKAHNIYMAVFAVMGTVGIILMLIHINRFFPPEMRGDGKAWQLILTNPGTWVLAAVCLLSFIRARVVQKKKGQ